MGLDEKSWDNAKQWCLKNDFTLFHCVEKHWLWALKCAKGIQYLLDYFQTHLDARLIY